jgi:hypothetical protein
VIRNGERHRIAGREVVRGDLLVLSEGDRVPADAVLVEARELQTDESLLTGESVPVRKLAGVVQAGAGARPGGDDLSYVFSGTLVVLGNSVAEVRATGANSEIDQIGKTLGGIGGNPASDAPDRLPGSGRGWHRSGLLPDSGAPLRVIAFIPLAAVSWLALRQGLPEGDARADIRLAGVDGPGLMLVNRTFSPMMIKAPSKGNRAFW